MTEFFTICALTNPSTSVRKSSRRSLQRMPPRAMRPLRRCTPSTRGEHTQISNIGRGSGRSGTLPVSNFNARTSRRPSLGPGRNALVRTVASMSARKARSVRSSSRFGTASSASRMAARDAATNSSLLGRSGVKRSVNNCTNWAATVACRASVVSMYCWLNGKPIWRR
jgi:hypothetical protein